MYIGVIHSGKENGNHYLGCRGFSELGVSFWGPYNKDYSILGSILGSPFLGKLPVGKGVGRRL